MAEKIPDLVCRPASEADTPAMLELTRTIWEGHDYVPQVWAEWLADPHGQLAVAEWQGRVVGLGKLTRLSDRDWWLEGLRTHPELEGRGIAARLHEYLLSLWLLIGSGTLRLSTFRPPVIHLCERTGFHKAGEFSFFRTPVVDEAADSFQQLSINEAGAALDLALNSQSLAFSNGLMDLGWRWGTPSSDFLSEAARNGKAWWWRGRQGVLVLTEDTDDEDHKVYPEIMLLGCTEKDTLSLLEDYRRLAKALGYEQASWAAPLNPALLPHLDAAGFVRTWDGALFIYARKHPVV